MLRYPDGPSGVALVLLRLSASAAGFEAFDAVEAARGWPGLVLSCSLALLLTAGIATRTAALLLGLLLFAGWAMSADADSLGLAAAGSAVSLAALGPGAYSLDAKRFGRRVIRVEARPPNRGGPE